MHSNYVFVITALMVLLSGCGNSIVETPTTEEASSTYDLSAMSNEGGTISPTSINVGEGSTAIFTLTPDENYTLNTVTGCDGSLVNDIYTTGAITEPCEVTVNYIADTINHVVSASSSDGGSILPESIVVEEGTFTRFTLTANENYIIDTVTGCNGLLVGNIYTTGDITEACDISAHYIIPTISYAVTTDASEGGRIFPELMRVEAGSATTFSLIADDNYIIDTAVGCNGVLEGEIYTTDVISEACKISVNYLAKTPLYTVSALTSEGGIITPTSIVVEENAVTEFTLTANEYYQIESVTGCNGSLLDKVYTTGAITQTCEVTVNYVAPTPVYHVSTSMSQGDGNGTAIDNKTSLLWMRCSLGQTWNDVDKNCTGTATTYNWEQALSAANETHFAEQSGWRLPNVKELNSLAEQACAAPVINVTVFPNTPSENYWTSSTYLRISGGNAWNIDFSNGRIAGYAKSNNYHVRLVRGGQ